MYLHLIKVGRVPNDGFAGEGAAKRKNAMSQMWTAEFLKHTMERTPEKTIGIDLCAGLAGCATCM